MILGAVRERYVGSEMLPHNATLNHVNFFNEFNRTRIEDLQENNYTHIKVWFPKYSDHEIRSSAVVERRT